MKQRWQKFKQKVLKNDKNWKAEMAKIKQKVLKNGKNWIKDDKNLSKKC